MLAETSLRGVKPEAIQKKGLDCFTLRVRNDEKSNT